MILANGYPKIKSSTEDGNKKYLFINDNEAIQLEVEDETIGYVYYDNPEKFVDSVSSGFPLLYRTVVENHNTKDWEVKDTISSNFNDTNHTDSLWQVEVFLDPFKSIQIIFEQKLEEKPWYNYYEDESPIPESMICMNCCRFQGDGNESKNGVCDRDKSQKYVSDTCDKFAVSPEYDFDMFWKKEGKDMFESHLDAWFFEQYHGLNRGEVEVQFNGHDNSLEEESAEAWLQRKLTTKETDNLEELFLESILDNIEFSGRETDEDFQIATGYYNTAEDLITPKDKIKEISWRF